MNKELCIRYGRPTPYDIHTPITNRLYYIVDSGQLCEDCWKRVYGEIKTITLPTPSILSGIGTVGLLQSVDLAVEMVKNGDLGILVPAYTDINVSDKVVRIIQSFVGVVNKMVWRKF